jgi:hypothetical protein
MISPLIAAEPSGKHEEGRTKPLAAAIDKVLSHRGKAGDLGSKPDLKLLLHLLHIVSDQIEEFLHDIHSPIGFYTEPPPHCQSLFR